MLENKFKTGLIRELKERFPGCMVVHLDPNEIQGIPDLLVLYGTTWGALEGKKSASAPHRPNQDYYVQQICNGCARQGTGECPEDIRCFYTLDKPFFRPKNLNK